MPNIKKTPAQSPSSTPKSHHTSITQIIGSVPILPGESEELYETGLAALIEELEAKTALQIYLAEKIYESLWWIRRYQEQKRATIISEMAIVASGGAEYSITTTQIKIREALLCNKSGTGIESEIGRSGHSLQSLRQRSMQKKQGELLRIDQQIALQTKTLAGIQASYEVAVNRKINMQRLILQNEIMRKDLDSINVAPLAHDNPKKTNS